MIDFSQIPAVYRVPGNYQEIDNSLANTSVDTKNVLMIGQKTDAGTADHLTVYEIPDFNTAYGLFGNGSELALMAQAFKKANTTQKLFAIAVPAGDATTTTTSITIDGAALKSGLLYLNLNGTGLPIAINKDDTKATIARNIQAVINGALNLSVEATKAVAGVVELVSFNKGITAGDITLTANCDDFGLTLTITTNAGVGTPDISAVWSILGETAYNWILQPYTDEANLKSLDDELNSRYDAMRQIGGRAFIAIKGDVATVKAFGQRLNSPHITCLDMADSATPAYLGAVINCAYVAKSLAADPAAPVANMPLKGIALPTTQRSSEDMNALLFAGISPMKVASPYAVLVRQITLYKTNEYGQDDNSYLDIQIPEILDAMRYYRRAEMQKLFAGYKLAQTEETFGANQKVMTATQFKAFLIALYQEVFVKEKAWCQDSASYQETLKVQLDANDKNRLNYQDQPTLIGQFLISAGKVQFN